MSVTGQPWRPAGIHAGEHHADPRGRLEKWPLLLGRATSLVELQNDYTFFGPGLLYKLRLLTDLQLLDCAAAVPGVRFFHARFKNPLFRGLNVGHDPAWNFVLWAVRRDHWGPVYDFLVSLTLYEHDQRLYHRFAGQDFLVPDPLAGSRARLKIYTLGIDSTTGQYAYRQQANGLLQAARWPPSAKLQRLAQAFFAGHSAPLSVVEEAPALPDLPPVQPRIVRVQDLTPQERAQYERSLAEFSGGYRR